MSGFSSGFSSGFGKNFSGDFDTGNISETIPLSTEVLEQQRVLVDIVISLKTQLEILEARLRVLEA